MCFPLVASVSLSVSVSVSDSVSEEPVSLSDSLDSEDVVTSLDFLEFDVLVLPPLFLLGFVEVFFLSFRRRPVLPASSESESSDQPDVE